MKAIRIKKNEINRGIVLALVLAVGTTGYVIAQNIRFQNNIPELEAQVESLGREMAETNIGSGEAVRRKQRAFVQNSFIEAERSATNLMGMTMTKSSMIYELNQPTVDSGEVLSAEFELTNTDVKKSGTNGANVTIDYRVSFEVTNAPELFSFTGVQQTGYYFDIGDDVEAHKIMRLKGTATMYMLPDGDDWKIASISTDGWFDFDWEYANDEGGGSVG